jgi:hypothetical protein
MPHDEGIELGWPKWWNGDWRILEAECLRNQSKTESVLRVLDGMQSEIPARLSVALCGLANEEYGSALELVEYVCDDQLASQYEHPEGRPDAVARAVKSLVLHREGDARHQSWPFYIVILELG